MSLQLQGKITHIGPREEKSAKFTLRKFSIETSERHPQPVVLQLKQDRCDLIDRFQKGDAVTVHFDIEGTMWNDKIINNLNVWKMEAI